MLQIGDIQLPDFPLLLAPMEDVSDPPFRSVCKQNGADLMYTEFISSEGLIRDAIKSRQKLDIFEAERPIGIQVFGGDEEALTLSAKIVEATGPDLIDINFGCPVKKVVCKGAGAGILKDLPKMIALTKAVVNAVKIPVTVKTRLGWDEQSKNIEEVAERLQDVGIKALSIHGRTRAQMYKGEADWSLIAAVKNNPRIRYGVDGVMIGRAAIGYPWIFREIKHYIETGITLPPPDIEERIRVCRQHLEFSLQWKGPKLGILEMRPHYANYLRGLSHIKEFRHKLVHALDAEEVLTIFDEILEYYGQAIS
jgi:tRNA-dihydrouridine synthase